MGVPSLLTCLKEHGIEHEPNAPLGPLTTFRIGGCAAVLIRPGTVEELQRTLWACLEQEVPWRLLGKGSNVLIPDSGFAGAVIVLHRFGRMLVCGERVEVEAGYSFPKLVQQTVWMGLGGLEGLGGIPANVGGALYMNAGGRFGEIFDVVESVTIMDPLGNVQQVNRKDIPFSYRKSGLDGSIILAGTLRLRRDDEERVRSMFLDVVRKKRGAQPMNEPSAGCIFKNPKGQSAGLAIEACGLKGLSVGEAMVSRKHANFIVNCGRARAEEVLRLIEIVREQVSKRMGLSLELEVKVW
jgi:UDP-N-acetylmuramate dehydrogenase